MKKKKGSQRKEMQSFSSHDAWMEYIQTKTKTTSIKDTETFSFECQKCTRCCRNAHLSIFYEAIDIYKLMKRLHLETGKYHDIDTILDQYATIVYSDENVRFPVLAIKTKAYMDTCVFLKSGKCSIYESRPLICRTYPLIVSQSEHGEEYHISREHPHHFRGEALTVRQYVDRAYTEEAREYLKHKDHYYKLMFDVLKGFTPACWEPAEVFILSMEYFGYDTDVPFIPQYKDNMGTLIYQLKSIIDRYSA